MRVGLLDADLSWGNHANGRRYGKTKADIFPLGQYACYLPQGKDL